MSDINRRSLRTVLISCCVTTAAILLLGAATVFAVCVPGVYNVTSSAPPPIGNWTDNSGAVWTPPGGFPGCAPGDVAQDLNATPTTLIINSAIPNPVIGLNLGCPGCTIDIQSGGSLTLAGAGSVSSSSTIIVEPGGTLTIANGGTLTFNSGTSLSVNGGNVDLQSGGTLNLNGASTSTNGGVLNVNGGTLQIGALFNVQSNGTLQFTAGSVTGSNTINNNGTVQMTGSGVVNVSPILNNKSSGTVTVSSGTLSLGGGGTGDGPFNIATGAVLDFPSATYTMTPNGVISGPGTLSLSGGTLSIGGVTSPGGFTFTAGTLTGAGFLSVTNTMNWSGGTLTGSGGAELAGTGTGFFDGSLGTMILDGRSFNNYGTVHYQATNPLQLGNGATFNTYGVFLFENDDSITCNCSGQAPSFNVFPNGFVDKTGGTGVSTIFTPSINDANIFVFTGTLNFAGNHTSNGGSFAISNSTLQFSAPTTTFNSSSQVGADGGATVLFTAGTATFIDSDYSVSGLTSITGGTVVMQTSADTNQFSFTGGTLTADGDFTVTGTGTWSGGTMNGGGLFDVNLGAVLTIDAATGFPTIDGGGDLVFGNDGTVNYTATQASGKYLTFANGAFFDNTGTFDIQADAPIATGGVVLTLAKNHASSAERVLPGGTGRRRAIASAKRLRPRPATCGCPNDFNNDSTGIVMKTGSGSTDFVPDLDTAGFVKAANGTLNFMGQYNQSDGSTTLGPGSITVEPANNFELNGGFLDGSGTITGNLDNYGEIKPGTTSATGVINLTGNYTGGVAGSGGTLTIKLAGPSAGQFDQLNVTGTATIDGTFDASFIGGYTPATGTTNWPVFTYSSVSGAFATTTLPTYPNGVVTSAYTPTAFVLTAVTQPSADLNLAMSGPGTVNAASPLSYTINVSNLGTDPTSGVISVADTLPSGATAASGSGIGWNCGAPSSGVITCTNPGPLTSGNTLPALTISMTAPAASGNVTNSATVSNSVSDPNPTNNTASVTTNVGPQANLSITKSGPASVNAGQNIVYTIVVTNAGPSPATGTSVSDPTPVGIAFISNTGGCTTAFPCSLGTLVSGQSVTITSTYNVPGSYSGSSVVNTASVSSAVNDPNLTDNSATATTTVVAGAGNADVSVTKTGPPSVAAGQNIVYTITVSNAGPASAANTFVNDPTPAGLTFVSNSGGCAGPFPCALGTMASGQNVTITATYKVPANYAGTTVTNTATVSTSSPETNTSNNSATAITPISIVGTVADLSVSKNSQPEANPGNIVSFSVIIVNKGPGAASNTVVTDPTPSGLVFLSNSGACTTPYPCSLGTLASGTTVVITSTYLVSAQSGSITNTATVGSSATDPVPGNNSGSSTVNIVPGILCPKPPVLTSPATGATVSSPVTLTWSAVAGATNYVVTITGPAGTQTIATNTASLTLSLSNGAYSWKVEADGTTGCTPAISATSAFVVCNLPGAPVPSVVALSTTGQTYTITWTAVDGATSYELQESADAAFSAPTSTSLTVTSQTFTKNVQSATAFYYRIRVVGSCSQSPGPFSATAPVVVIPLPAPGTLNPNIPLPAGSTQPVTFLIHVPGLPGGATTSFVATADKPWLAVAPASGIMPPEGVTFTISADPSSLQNGTWTGTIIIVFGSSSVSGKTALDVAPKTSIPVSISLTTPVTPSTLSGPAATAVVIPSVGHLAGLGSQWLSDIRIANITAFSKNVLLTFSAGSPTSSAVKQTTINIAAGATSALDDIVRNWYGVGALGESTNGVLTLQPLDATGKPDLSVTTATVAASRTYNASAVGTLGQFIPAVPLASFISKAPGAASTLTLQQIAQTDTFRTNLGLVEVTGNPATLLVSVFNAAGNKLLDLPVSLGAGEQRQLNSFLADRGITLTNGHIEVQATGGTGKVTAYASVIDDQSTDPLFVSGVPLGGVGATRFVIAGVANLNTGASWRSDVRIFNGSAAPQTARLTLYPSGSASASTFSDVTIQPGEVKALDDVVNSTFNLTNASGALHVTTALAAPLVVTARTYNATANGTLGQFIEAVTPADAVGSGERSLQLLQMEDSTRYRGNVGVAEVTGNSATAEITVILPDSKVAPKVQIPLAAFESRQFGLSSFGLGNAYNARVSVRVIDGQGKITAYGSVIDQSTQAPTFVPAQ